MGLVSQIRTWVKRIGLLNVLLLGGAYMHHEIFEFLNKVSGSLRFQKNFLQDTHEDIFDNHDLSWLYHHSAKFRDINTQQVAPFEIDKFIGSDEQMQVIKKYYNDTLKLIALAETAKPPVFPTKWSLDWDIIDWMDVDAKQRMVDNVNTIGYAVVSTNQTKGSQKVMDWMFPDGEPSNTHVGRTFSVEPRKGDVEFAYSSSNNNQLMWHQDMPFYSAPPSILVLHCYHQAHTGGATLLKPTYVSALKFKKEHPKEYKVLSENDITFYRGLRPEKYLVQASSDHRDNGEVNILLNKRVPIMEHDTHGKLIRVNWSQLAEGFTNVRNWEQFYNAYHTWKDFLEEIPAARVVIQPGHLLIFHNSHHIHSRESFQGRRRLRAWYVREEKWRTIVNMVKLGDFA